MQFPFTMGWYDTITFMIVYDNYEWLHVVFIAISNVTIKWMDEDLCLPGGPYKSTIFLTLEERFFLPA